MDVLWEIGLRGGLYELIRQCITTVGYRVVVNGEKTDGFHPSCGLWKGDPLSPYFLSLAWTNVPI